MGREIVHVLEQVGREKGLKKEILIEAIETAGGALGIRIAFLVNLLNPDVVVVGGGIEQAGSVLLDSVRRSVKKWAFEEMAEVVKIIPARLGPDSVPLGAASLVIRNVFSKV